MRRRRVHLVSMYLGLAAYVLNATALAWGFVQCEEPGGQFAIELAGAHGQCLGPSMPTHGHEETDLPSMECDICSFCPCIDTPIGVALAAPTKKSDPPQPSVLAGKVPADAAAAGWISRRLPIPLGRAALPDPVTRRCLRTIVLLV